MSRACTAWPRAMCNLQWHLYIRLESQGRAGARPSILLLLRVTVSLSLHSIRDWAATPSAISILKNVQYGMLIVLGGLPRFLYPSVADPNLFHFALYVKIFYRKPSFFGQKYFCSNFHWARRMIPVQENTMKNLTFPRKTLRFGAITKIWVLRSLSGRRLWKT